MGPLVLSLVSLCVYSTITWHMHDARPASDIHNACTLHVHCMYATEKNKQATQATQAKQRNHSLVSQRPLCLPSTRSPLSIPLTRSSPVSSTRSLLGMISYALKYADRYIVCLRALSPPLVQSVLLIRLTACQTKILSCMYNTARNNHAFLAKVLHVFLRVFRCANYVAEDSLEHSYFPRNTRGRPDASPPAHRSPPC